MPKINETQKRGKRMHAESTSPFSLGKDNSASAPPLITHLLLPVTFDAVVPMATRLHGSALHHDPCPVMRKNEGRPAQKRTAQRFSFRTIRYVRSRHYVLKENKFSTTTLSPSCLFARCIWSLFFVRFFLRFDCHVRYLCTATTEHSC